MAMTCGTGSKTGMRAFVQPVAAILALRGRGRGRSARRAGAFVQPVTAILATAALAGTGAVLAGGGTVRAEPVAEHERVPVDLRRTTLVVRDIERSLRFYRDALGMRVIYDNLITTPRGVDPDDAERAMRFVMLRANDDFVGVLGLLQYFKPVKETVDLTGTAFMEGTIAMVFDVDDLAGSFARATAIPGVTVLDEPASISYPSGDGQGSIDVIVSTLQDPDGFTLELSQVREPPR